MNGKLKFTELKKKNQQQCNRAAREQFATARAHTKQKEKQFAKRTNDKKNT